MPEPLGWLNPKETPEGYISLLVIRHPDGVSLEGAQHQRHEVERAATDAGLELYGSSLGRGVATAEARKALWAVWGAGE